MLLLMLLMTMTKYVLHAGSCGGSWLSADMERPPPPPHSLTSSSSSCIVGMPPSAPHGRVTWSRSSSRLSAVLPRPFRRRPRGPDQRTATLPPAQQPLLAVGASPRSPYNRRHWYDPGYSRTLLWNGREKTAARPGTARTLEPTSGRRRAADVRNGGWSYAQCNGGPRRRTTTKPDESHSTEQLDTWTNCVDEETDEDRITGRFSWSLACLKDLENGNESDAVQSLVKPVDEDDGDKETSSELNNPFSTAVSG